MSTPGIQRGQKLNQLQRLLPEGLVVDAAWLEARGYARALRKKYVDHGWLEQPARAVYARPGRPVRAEQIIISLQSLMHVPVVMGGRSALERQGFAHDLRLGAAESVSLYAEVALPGWVDKLPLPATFAVHKAGRLFPVGDIARAVAALPPGLAMPERPLPGGLRALGWGSEQWPMLVSGPERAILELLDEVPGTVAFEQADQIFEGLSTLRPAVAGQLLQDCRSIKVRRLFFWFADRHRHAWRRRLDPRTFDLGRGKRVIAKGGRLDATYSITVPRSVHANG